MLIKQDKENTFSFEYIGDTSIEILIEALGKIMRLSRLFNPRSEEA